MKDFQLEQAFGFNVNRTAFLMTEEISKRFAAEGYQLSAQDFGIILRLSKQEPMTQREITQLMLRDKTTITRRIDKLVKSDLVERETCSNDRRQVNIKLTAAGHAALKATIPIVQAFQTELYQDIPEEDQLVAIKTLKNISAKLMSKK